MRATFLGFGVLILVGVPADAQTNSWISPSDGAWHDAANWSLTLPPTNTQSVYVTNDVTKTVTINSITSGSHPDTLTISNLLLSALTGATNTLNLSGAGTNAPLVILDSFNVSAGGMLRLTNSALWVQGIITNVNTNAVVTVTNSAFSCDGTIVLRSNGLLTADTGLYAGLDTNVSSFIWLAGGLLVLTNTPPSAIGITGPSQLVVSNGHIQTSSGFVFVGSDKGSQGVLKLAGGDYVSSAFGRLVIGMETGAVGIVSVRSGNLIVTNSFITLVGGDGAGELDLLGGTNILGPLQVGGNPGSVGTLTVASGAQTFQGGVLIGSSPNATGTVWLTGGQVIATNFSTCVATHGYGLLAVSNGTWLGKSMRLGLYAIRELRDSYGSLTQAAQPSHGALEVDGGTVALLSNLVAGSTATISNLVIGNCPSGAVGVVRVAGGSLYVTNAAHNAVLDLRDGQVILDSGLLQVDKLVITNLCGQFIRNGGTLIVSNLVLTPSLDADGDGMLNGWEQAYGLDPLSAGDANNDADGDGFSNLQEFLAGTDPTNSASSFRITSILPQGSDLLITWSVTTSKTYKVQATTESVTNTFIDLATVNVGATPPITATNYLDMGGATNSPPRFYKIKLVTP